MKNAKMLEIVKITVIEHAEYGYYKVMKLKQVPNTVNHPVTGKPVAVFNTSINQRLGTLTKFEVSRLESMKGQPDFGYELNVGDFVQGDIITRETHPYTFTIESTGEVIADNTNYTTVVEGDSSNEDTFEAAIVGTFRRNKRPVISDLPMQANNAPASKSLDDASDLSEEIDVTAEELAKS